MSGSAFEDDCVAEGFELADVFAAAAVGVCAPGVEVRAEVGVARFGVGEQVPDDHQGWSDLIMLLIGDLLDVN